MDGEIKRPRNSLSSCFNEIMGSKITILFLCFAITFGWPNWPNIRPLEKETRIRYRMEKLMKELNSGTSYGAEQTQNDAAISRAVPASFLMAMWLRVAVTVASAISSLFMAYLNPMMGFTVSPTAFIQFFDSAEHLLRVYYL